VKLALERGFHPIILEAAHPAHASDANSEARCLRPVNGGGNDFHSSSFHVLASQVMPHLRIVTLNCGSALTELPRRKVLYATRTHELQNRSGVLAAT
jgi:hypothetical protein